MVKGIWSYQHNIESWPNLFSLYSLEKLGVMRGHTETYCDKLAGYLQNPAYSALKTDPWLSLCFLMEFQKTHGWQAWQRFFARLNMDPDGSVIDSSSDATVWRFVRDRLTQAVGQDVSPTFDRWRVPY
ncbi:MAG: hypothetical protein MJD61_16080 [Proteobacteria bacterium]|nr:hypothetical protein [Pseudomonadota bacterium]